MPRTCLAHTLRVLLAPFDEAAGVVLPVVELLVRVQESGRLESTPNRRTVTLPQHRGCDLIVLEATQVPVRCVFERPPPEEVEQSNRLPYRDVELFREADGFRVARQFGVRLNPRHHCYPYAVRVPDRSRLERSDVRSSVSPSRSQMAGMDSASTDRERISCPSLRPSSTISQGPADGPMT